MESILAVPAAERDLVAMLGIAPSGPVVGAGARVNPDTSRRQYSVDGYEKGAYIDEQRHVGVNHGEKRDLKPEELTGPDLLARSRPSSVAYPVFPSFLILARACTGYVERSWLLLTTLCTQSGHGARAIFRLDLLLLQVIPEANSVMYEVAAVGTKLRNVMRMGGERVKEMDHFVDFVKTPKVVIGGALNIALSSLASLGSL